MNPDLHHGRVIVALSGGVDSSVAALLLKQAGYQVEAVTMVVADHHLRLGLVQSASKVAHVLGIPHRVVDLQQQFTELVVQPFVHTYLCGETPNPCIECNHLVKWGLLRTIVDPSGQAYFATGHYARIGNDGQRFWLERGAEPTKEQSYYLARLTQDELRMTMFPLGEYTKPQVRRIAAAHLLPVQEKESQEICFIERNDYKEFLAQHAPEALPRPGKIVDRSGNVLGLHPGIHNYTIGQRSGLGIAAAHPLYVLALDASNNTVIVGKKEDCRQLRATVDRLSWMAIDRPLSPRTVSVQVRYRHRAALATIIPAADSVIVEFQEPVTAITPGQTAVFYDHGKVLGCGRIRKA